MSSSTPLVPVVLCGGSGTRLWPLSRQGMPKQFLPLPEGNLTLLQQTLQRTEALTECEPILLCNSDHRFMVADQLRDWQIRSDAPQSTRGRSRILLEPVARNTAPAIAMAALDALARFPAGVHLLVLPSDHVIADPSALQQATRTAQALADALPVAFGVVPTRAETGFGYLEAGSALPGHDAHQVKRFVEKPDASRAAAYLASGHHYWNSGMFLLDASQLLDALRELAPEVASAAAAAWAGRREDDDFVRLAAAPLQDCPTISIDYAVMERLTQLAMVPLNAGWDDLGSFQALWQRRRHDEHGNASTGPTVMVNTRNSLIHADSRLIATLGLDDLIIIDTPDVLMVTSRDASGNIRELVEAIGVNAPELL